MHHTDTHRQLALRGCRRIHQMHERQGDPLHATSRIANLVCRSSIPRARFLTDSFSIFHISRSIPGRVADSRRAGAACGRAQHFVDGGDVDPFAVDEQRRRVARRRLEEVGDERAARRVAREPRRRRRDRAQVLEHVDGVLGVEDVARDEAERLRAARAADLRDALADGALGAEVDDDVARVDVAHDVGARATLPRHMLDLAQPRTDDGRHRGQRREFARERRERLSRAKPRRDVHASDGRGGGSLQPSYLCLICSFAIYCFDHPWLAPSPAWASDCVLRMITVIDKLSLSRHKNLHEIDNIEATANIVSTPPAQ
mgnify:CR=1 FL=1